ncbi:MAG: EAL domain-containing protein [Gammaproteobacteria bacterium]|nr:EAL domain-containing protein [Gammaproteobacteria bacterium]MDH5651596.1 EAL domain-containing protein [Gammaproteobacteria bacterium]
MSLTPLKNLTHSLRVRYAVIAILFGSIVMLAATVAYFSISVARHTTANSIQDRQQLLQQIRHIRNNIWHSYVNLELFLSNPINDQSQDRIHFAIQEAIDNTQGLQHSIADLPSLNKRDIITLLQLLDQLDKSVSQLISVRMDAVKQYPSLALARGDMLQYNTEFNTAASLAINELSNITESKQRDKAIYTAFVQARHHWTQMTSNFRMYLANRLGTFDNNVFFSQIKDIELQREALHIQLQILEQNKDYLDLQSSTSLQTMLGATGEWYESFKKVKRIHESDAWRTDAVLIREQVKPLLEQIWNKLQALDIAAETSAEQDVQLLSRLARSQNDTFWLLAALAILFIIASYIVLDKSVLRPLSILTNALKAEAHNETGYPLPEVTNLETQHLMEAFAEMRKQIHSRQRALEHQALHDNLTGLANRTLLLDRLNQAIQHAKRHHTSVSLLIIDLDRFKEVNDTLGHQVGDHLLKEVGIRLTASLRQIDTVTRLGGDEFAILLPDDDEQQAAEVAQKILKILDQEFLIEDMGLFIGASIGIASCPHHSDNVQDLIKYADVAMYNAKRNKLGFAIYDAKRDPHSIDQLSLGSDLRGAPGTEAVKLVYQPKVNIKTGKLCGVEALFRWTHPTLGPVSAEEAIRTAEQTGYINTLTQWIIKEALQQHKQWREQGYAIHIAINLSAYSLQSDQTIAEFLDTLSPGSFQKQVLSFELTESAMMFDPEHAIRSLQRISDAGVSISIDDFGTGFSSFSYLKQMPVNELKVDKSFVVDMINNESDDSIVHSIIDLAHNLGLKVVAEGVENRQTWQRLKELNCDVVQGNYCCKPLPADELLDWCKQNTGTDNIKYSA